MAYCCGNLRCSSGQFTFEINNMRVFKTLWFHRYARKHGIEDKCLWEIAENLENGIFGVDLGGNVYKERLGREHEGKSGGYRIIVCFKIGHYAFFTYGFAKSDRENITVSEKEDLKKLANILLGLTDKVLDEKIAAGAFKEIDKMDAF